LVAVEAAREHAVQRAVRLEPIDLRQRPVQGRDGRMREQRLARQRLLRDAAPQQPCNLELRQPQRAQDGPLASAHERLARSLIRIGAAAREQPRRHVAPPVTADATRCSQGEQLAQRRERRRGVRHRPPRPRLEAHERG